MRSTYIPTRFIKPCRVNHPPYPPTHRRMKCVVERSSCRVPGGPWIVTLVFPQSARVNNMPGRPPKHSGVSAVRKMCSKSRVSRTRCSIPSRCVPSPTLTMKLWGLMGVCQWRIRGCGSQWNTNPTEPMS